MVCSRVTSGIKLRFYGNKFDVQILSIQLSVQILLIEYTQIYGGENGQEQITQAAS